MGDPREERAATGDLRAYTALEWLTICLRVLPAAIVAVIILGTIGAATMAVAATAGVAGLAGLGAMVRSATPPPQDPKRQCEFACEADGTSPRDWGDYRDGVCSCMYGTRVMVVVPLE